MYVNSLFPFIENSDFIRNYDDPRVEVNKVYCPVDFGELDLVTDVADMKKAPRVFKIYHILPCDVFVFDEREDMVKRIVRGEFGYEIPATITEIDYSPVAQRIEIDSVDGKITATMQVGDGFESSDIVTDVFILSASNGTPTMIDLVSDIRVPFTSSVSLMAFLNDPEFVQESVLDTVRSRAKERRDNRNNSGYFPEETESAKSKNDSIYQWLDSYFALPEGKDLEVGGREVVPLLIGPTAVFKSATVKELCKKYNYRMVDFRVSFTSRLDYTGLYQIGDLDGDKYSYSCPMEELVTCSDGFREYCVRAYDKIQEILVRGYLEEDKVSDGATVSADKVPLSDDQKKRLEKLLDQYAEYKKPVCLFFDEITRCFSGNTRIRLLDGRSRSMKELHEEYGTDRYFWVYSCDRDGNVRFAKARSVGVTRKNARMLKVVLDNGAEVVCTPDHKWMLRDGSYEQAQHFEEGRSLMGVYFGSYCSTNTGFGSEYETYLNPADGEELFTHRVVMVEWVDETEDAYDIEVPEYHNFLIDLGDDSGVFVHNCKDNGVNGILVQLLNQKRFNNMTMNKCKFVAATNLDLEQNEDYKDKLEDLYDVSQDLDAAYSNRFMPIQVTPEKVRDRWFEWAKGGKSITLPDGNEKIKTNIHPLIIEFFNKKKVKAGDGKSYSGMDMIYNNRPVKIAIDEDKSDNEIKAETFPNYRTWDLFSSYLYSMDRDYEIRLKENSDAKKEYRGSVVDGLISSWAGVPFKEFLNQKGYVDFEIGKDSSHASVEKYPDYDDVGDFLNSTLDAGTPALLIGPSSLGKTSRIKAYMKRVEKRTGLKPVYIEVNLAAMNADTLLGMPVKQKLADYVSGGDLGESGLDSVGKELSGIMKNITEDFSYGLTDSLTRRAPDMTIKERFKKALDEGREVVINFDECNRCKNSTVMSALFEAISDSRLFGIDFSKQKDKVKIVAACNMSYAGMDDEEGVQDYTAAGSIDPALAARFAVKWKKKYDERDVRSWMNFMREEANEGHIDSIVVDWFDSFIDDEGGVERAINIIKSVEKRTIESAQPSTRMLLQLSKEIKEMSDPSTALFKGQVLFIEANNDELARLNGLRDQSGFYDDPVSVANSVIAFAEKRVLGKRNSWDAMRSDKNMYIDVNKERIYPDDVMAGLSDVIDHLKAITANYDSSQSGECADEVNSALMLLEYCQKFDRTTITNRREQFERYFGNGEETGMFLKFFNENFGNADLKVVLPIDVCLDGKTTEFMEQELNKFYRSTNKKLPDFGAELLREFVDNLSGRAKPEDYKVFVDEMVRVLFGGMTDNLVLLIGKSADPDIGRAEDTVFTEAEKAGGDGWIKNIVSCLHIANKDIQASINAMRDRMAASGQFQDLGDKRRTRIL